MIDVGYAGTIGADRITHGEPIYGEGEFPDDNRFGDTYGPANYYAYVPFELALPWSGELGRAARLARGGDRLRPRGRRSACSSAACGCGRAAAGASSAIVLAFAWLAYPYTDFALQSNSNDSLVAALLVWSLALFARPLARGALLALAAMAKFAPLALAPLYAAGDRGLLDATGAPSDRRPRGSCAQPCALFAAAFAVVAALMLAHPAIDPGLATFCDRTVASQLDRTSPFSIWGQVDGIQWLQTAMFALPRRCSRSSVAFVPRRADARPGRGARRGGADRPPARRSTTGSTSTSRGSSAPLAIALAASVPRERLADRLSREPARAPARSSARGRRGRSRPARR